VKAALAIGVAVVTLVTLATPAAPAVASPSGETPAALFSISKSENKNLVQFFVRLDARCSPVGQTPVYAYWRMLEKGATATEPLLDREQPAYGIASQSVEPRGEGGATVHMTLRALPHTPLLVESGRAADGACTAWVRTPIDGVDAKLFNVHVVLRWPFGVARLLVTGWSAADGHLVREARQP
jgi:hypothetical protein